MKKLLVIALVLIAVPAFAQTVTYCYSWENGGTILGLYGNLVGAANVSGPQAGLQGSTLPGYTCPGAYDGENYLHVAEDPHDSMPYAILAWVTGAVDGDFIHAEFQGYDVTAGGSPSLRIWGGYTDDLDPNNYVSSAGSTGEYTSGDPAGWCVTESDWTYAGGPNSGLTIQARLYSTPSTSDPDHTDFWIDYVCVTVPDHCVVHFPPEGVSPVESSSWTNIKALYR